MSYTAYATIRQHVLERREPSPQEKTMAKKKFQAIRDYIAEQYGRDCDLMGSVGKDTFLKGNKDLDIFVFFDTETSRETVKSEILDIGKSVFQVLNGSYQISYAEHQYVTGSIGQYAVDIVPCYRLEEPTALQSAVDRTPFHKAWVNQHLSKAQKQDVIVLKQLLTAHNLYGSTLKIEGFSGYLCEVLIGAYGTYDQLLSAAQDWDLGEVIDPAQHYRSQKAAQQRFGSHPLIVIDPVDADRNVAAALHPDNMKRFTRLAQRFVQQPSIAFFERQEVAVDRAWLRKTVKERPVVSITLEKPPYVEDIVWPQLRKTARKVTQRLKQYGFIVQQWAIQEGRHKLRLVFEIAHGELSPTYIVEGPPVTQKEHVTRFTQKHEQTWEANGRILAEEERSFTDIITYLTYLLQEDTEIGLPQKLSSYLENAQIAYASVDGKQWNQFLMQFLGGDAE